jgi:hypothetical protein
MRTTSFIAAALLAASAAAAQAQGKIDIRRAASPTVSVRLSGAFSGVKVIAWQHDSIAITGSMGAGSRFDGGAFNATGPVNGMKFYLEAPDGAGTDANRLELRVPRSARVWIKGGSAAIDVQGVAGGLDLNIVGGSVTVTGKPRELIVESMDGSVSFNGDAAFAKIKTATGDITFVGRGEDMTLTTVSGTISVDGGGRDPVERARLESVTGPITFAADIKRGGDIRFDTHSGAIDLRLVPRADVELDAATVTGTIENRWNSGRPIAGREGRGMELGTSSGTGGARVQVRSFKGNLRVTTR